MQHTASTEAKILVIPKGASLSRTAHLLKQNGFIKTVPLFLVEARLFGTHKAIKAGEYEIRNGLSAAAIVRMLQSGDVLLHQLLVSEGMSAVQVYERINAEGALDGSFDMPDEGSILPDTYSFTRGEARTAMV